MVTNKINEGLQTPWKIWNELVRIFSYPMARLLFGINRIHWNKGWRLYGIPMLQKHQHSQITIGARLKLRSSHGSNPLYPNHPVVLCTWKAGAVLAIGEDFAMTGGTLCAAEKITIGDHVMVGANTTIADTDFHPINSAERLHDPVNGRTAPISIQDGVFIGMNSIILKGVTIGRGSVVGAGSVVTGDVPPGVIAAGNPARVIRSIRENE